MRHINSEEESIGDNLLVSHTQMTWGKVPLYKTTKDNILEFCITWKGTFKIHNVIISSNVEWF